MSEFDEDTRLDPDGPGHWRGALSDRWSQRPSGGYLASYLTRAIAAEAPALRPLALTVHYLVPATPGPVTFSIETLRAGRGHTTLVAHVEQRDRIAVALATFHDRRTDGAPSTYLSMPSIDPPAQCHPRRGARPARATIRDRFEDRLPPSGHPEVGGNQAGTGGGWTRMPDRPLDDLAVPVFLDAWPASIRSDLSIGPIATTPTLELTIHWHDQADTRWYLAWFHTTSLTGNHFVEHGALWAQDGTLVAESHQLALLVPTTS